MRRCTVQWSTERERERERDGAVAREGEEEGERSHKAPYRNEVRHFTYTEGLFLQREGDAALGLWAKLTNERAACNSSTGACVYMFVIRVFWALITGDGEASTWGTMGKKKRVPTFFQYYPHQIRFEENYVSTRT